MGMALAVHRFTVDEVRRMAQVGILHEDDRVELLDGQIVEMTPIGTRHAACVNRLNQLFVPLLASRRASVSIQNHVVLGKHQAPQPDVALLRFRADGYQTQDPGPADVLLVIEVADTTVASDRKRKIPLYARAGISEAWLVSLPADGIEIYRAPRSGQYRDARTGRRGETITPLAFPDLRLLVDDILG